MLVGCANLTSVVMVIIQKIMFRPSAQPFIIKERVVSFSIAFKVLATQFS